MWLLFLALSAAGSSAGRHRVSPNQQVWEQIRGNMERKKGATQAPPAKPAAVEVPQSETPEPVLAGLHKSKKLGSKFLQYTGRHPVGRHSRLSAVSQKNRVGGKSAATIAKSIERQISEMKQREAQRRLQKQHAAAAQTANVAGLTSRDRKKVVDTVFRPVNWDHHRDAPPAEGVENLADEDPFAKLHANFADEVRQEAKKEKMTLKKKVVAPAPLQSVEQDLKAKEAQVLAAAGADTPNKADFVFDVEKDNALDGVNAMVKDAEQLVTAQGEKAVDEAKKVGDAARAAKAAKEHKKEVERMPGAGGHLQPPAKKEETLAEALKGVKEAAGQRDLDKTASALGEIWAKKDHDKKLNSELATETKVNQVLEHARVEKAEEALDGAAGDQLDKIDQEWQTRFPETAKAAPVKPHGPVSGWGVMANELRN